MSCEFNDGLTTSGIDLTTCRETESPCELRDRVRAFVAKARREERQEFIAEVLPGGGGWPEGGFCDVIVLGDWKDSPLFLTRSGARWEAWQWQPPEKGAIYQCVGYRPTAAEAARLLDEGAEGPSDTPAPSVRE